MSEDINRNIILSSGVWQRSGVSNVSFEHIPHNMQHTVFLMINLNMYFPASIAICKLPELSLKAMVKTLD